MIKEISLRDIPGYYKFGKVQQEVNTFYQSGWPAAEVDTDGIPAQHRALARTRRRLKTYTLIPLA